MNKCQQLKTKDLPALREALLKKQKGKCAICGLKAERPVLDHHHKRKIKGTGLIRGVVCNKCNVLLGKVENNCVRFGIPQSRLPLILKGMAKYLTKTHQPFIHPSEAPKPKRLKKKSYNHLVRVLKAGGYKYKIPPYPKSKQLTKKLEELFNLVSIVPEFYK